MKSGAVLFITAWLCAIPALLCGSPNQTKDQPSAAAAENKNSPAQQVPHYHKTGRAFLESGLLLAGATIDYWRKYGNFKEDWQFELTWKDQRRRFFTAESPKFDSNSFWYNWSHALSGTYFYNCARTNGFNNRVSFLFSFGLSALWEVASEWREIISTNDMIMTSFGGPAIGEPLFQASSYFSHRRGFFNTLAGFIFNPFLYANNWFDRKSGRAANSAPDAGWHRFRLFFGSQTVSISPADRHSGRFNLGVEMETIMVPGYGKAQTFRRSLSDTLSSRLYLDFNYSSAGLEEYNIRTQAVLFGYSWQSLSEGEGGTLRGVSGSVGFGSGFDTYKKRPVAWYDSNSQTAKGEDLSDGRFWRPTPTQFTDKMATMNLMGPVFRLSGFGPRLHLRWTAEAFFDFAMINALAYNRYTEKHDPSGVKTTLLNWGYYYAWGTTLASDLAADWRQWRLRGNVSYQLYGSIQGQDRYQFLGAVTDDFRIRDSRTVWRFRVGYCVPRTPIELALAAEGIGRSGDLLELHDHYHENRIYTQLGLVF